MYLALKEIRLYNWKKKSGKIWHRIIIYSAYSAKNCRKEGSVGNLFKFFLFLVTVVEILKEC